MHATEEKTMQPWQQRLEQYSHKTKMLILLQKTEKVRRFP